MSTQRNTTMSIVKGIAIILMVFGHAECPWLITRMVYLFHMPIFFIAAGYFFSLKYVDNPWNFCVKRFKGLYVPFVKWSFFFLILHNIFFQFGILNEQYGNWEGGVTHPYSIEQILQRAVHIIFSMSGYDEFLAGAFWFFRALLISSILFLVFYKLLSGKTKWLDSTRNITIIICLSCLAFAFFKIYYGLKIATVVQGGIRETFGIFFFAAGVLYRLYQDKIKEHWLISIVYITAITTAAYFQCRGMSLALRVQDVVTLPLTGIIGFLMVHQISTSINSKETIVKRFLVYCGNNTLYIYVFHVLAFKAVSLVKIWWYNLDFGQIGCHMVIHEHAADDLFWILYTIAGVGLPLIWIYTYRKITAKYSNKRNIASKAVI